MTTQSVTTQHETYLCIICQHPIQRGEGRYRIAKGDMHLVCTKLRPKKTDIVDPHGPTTK